VIQYRTYRNTDSPGLAEVWNDALSGRGAVRLRTSSPLERFTFSKLFFDPKGLIIAEDDGRLIGFVHAGFGADAARNTLDTQTGVTCMLVVRPSYRGRGIATELLRQSEQYLRGRGAARLFGGAMAPLNPFYLGMYGGSDLPGVLASDASADLFFTRRGYSVCRTVKVLQRRLAVPIKVFDPRFVNHRQRFECQEDATSRLSSWWAYNVYSGAEPRVFSLIDKTNNESVAQATMWEMEGFSYRWGLPAAGVTDWWVKPELRKQGIGKFLMTQVLRKAQDELLELIELQLASDNEAAFKLCQGLGFEQVDTGRMYEKREQG